VTRWDEAFESSQVLAAVESARAQVKLAEKKVADEGQLEALSRVSRVIDLVGGVLAATDPVLVQPGLFEQTAEDLNQIATYLQNFVESPDAALLEYANNHVDAVLGRLPSLAPRTVPEEVQEVQSAVSTFRRSAGQLLRNIESDVAGLQSLATGIETRLGEQDAKIQGQDARLDTVVTEYQSQFSAAQEQRQTEFSQALEETRAQIAPAVNDAKEDLAQFLKETTAAQDEAFAKDRERADAEHQRLEAAGTERLAKLDELLDKAIKTVGVIGSTGMAGGYQIVADDERKAANIWRRWTVFALVGAIAVTIFAVAHGVVHDFNANNFFAKWAISVPFLALAAYAGHESSKHREQARVNRKVELQLASLDAYLVTLPEAEQDRLRAKLADRFFGEVTLSVESLSDNSDSADSE